jgi:hypothetical protein
MLLDKYQSALFIHVPNLQFGRTAVRGVCFMQTAGGKNKSKDWRRPDSDRRP